MFLLRTNLFRWLQRLNYFFHLSLLISLKIRYLVINHINLYEQIIVVGVESLGISIITASFIGMVFTLQVVKEFLYLDAANMIGAVLSLAFVRELSPVITSIIAIGRTGSAFTAEISTMKVTEQIDALYVLQTDPIVYLIIPRLLACMLVLPITNLVFFVTSLAISMFTCYVFYNLHPWLFFKSVFLVLTCVDILKSSFKVVVFAIIIANVSCAWGLYTSGGSKNIGESTTSSVVTNLLLIFITDFILSYVLFNQMNSAIQFL